MTSNSRRVLITGASRGIGRAIAHAFARHGDLVAVHFGHDKQRAEQTLAELPGDGHVLAAADLTDAAAIRGMVEQAVGDLGGLDVLVNNAAVFVRHEIGGVSYEQWQDAWRTTIETNLIGAANVTFCAARHLPRGGRVINISSRGAFRGEPEHPAYGASKAGLNAMGQSLALALAPHGISVTTVAPGYVETDMTNEVLKPPRGDEIRAQSPFDRLAEPGEVAAAVLYLASADAEFASGAILDVNGASYLRS